MPFQVSRENPARPQPLLRVLDSTRFRLESGFVYCHGATCVDVPADGPTESTDLATVPSWLWGLLASYGHQTLPALMHDRLCDAAAQETDPDARYRLRRSADDLFRVALLDEGVAPFRAATFWSGVVLGRFLLYRRIRSMLLLATVFVSTAAFYVGCILAIASSGNARWIGLLCAVGALVLAVPWYRDGVYAAVLVGTWVGLPVLVLLVADLLLQVWISVLPWLAQWALSVLPGVPKPSGTPTIRPTWIRPTLP